MQAVLLPGEGARFAAILAFGGQRLPCVVGAAGISAFKQEGDHATPAGLLKLRRILYRADRVALPPSGAGLPREPIAPDDHWCDDPHSAAYNRALRIAPDDPEAPHAERLWREDGLYDLIAVLGWNDAPVVRGRGSAIFLHAAPRGGGPTEGCIGVPPAFLPGLLASGLSAIDVRAG